jgi:hypothetical protein
MTNHYILYGTSACHLCEHAEEIIQSVNKNKEINYILLDISESEDLLETFGLIIPVLACTATREKLHWPFNEDALIAFINRTSSTDNKKTG